MLWQGIDFARFTGGELIPGQISLTKMRSAFNEEFDRHASREPCREVESLKAMVMHADTLNALSQAIYDALRFGIDMQPQRHAGAVISVREGKHVCAALVSPLDPMMLSRKMMLRQLQRLQRYASFQIALNRSTRVCVMFKPSMLHREDPELLRACIGLMLDLVDAR